jgi:phage repressor protein C with HTH and peptisase S24 domain
VFSGIGGGRRAGEGIYAVRMGGDGLVKRVTKVPGKVMVISDNPKYPSYEISEDSQDFELIDERSEIANVLARA